MLIFFVCRGDGRPVRRSWAHSRNSPHRDEPRKAISSEGRSKSLKSLSMLLGQLIPASAFKPYSAGTCIATRRARRIVAREYDFTPQEVLEADLQKAIETNEMFKQEDAASWAESVKMSEDLEELLAELKSNENMETVVGEGSRSASKPENETLGWWDEAQATLQDIIGPKLREDRSLPARRLDSTIDVVNASERLMQALLYYNVETEKFIAVKQVRDQASSDLMPSITDMSTGLLFDYYVFRVSRAIKSKRLRSNLPLITNVFNVALVALVLRASLPRLLAMSSMADLGDFATTLGLPSRTELQGYLAYADGLDLSTKLAAYAGVWLLEKVFLLGALVPLGSILPTISPAIFGGVIQGSLATGVCSSLGATVSFFLGRNFLTERIKKFNFGEDPPLEEAAWFKAVNKRFDSSQFPDQFPPEGFKSALLLRLAPVLPIPVDGHWYVAGTTPVKYPEFILAYFIGTMKVAIIDAFFGNLLLQAVSNTDELADGAKLAVGLETAFVILVSVVVSNLAIGAFTEAMAEEGVDITDMTGAKVKSKDTI